MEHIRTSLLDYNVNDTDNEWKTPYQLAFEDVRTTSSDDEENNDDDDDEQKKALTEVIKVEPIVIACKLKF